MHFLAHATDFQVTLLPWKIMGILVAVMAILRFAFPKFYRTYVWSEDHKMISKQFLVSSVLWGIAGGALALGVRWQLAWPGSPIPLLGSIFGWKDGIMPPEGYNVVFTMHASIMIFLVIIPILAGAFANFCVPLMIGAKDMAFPFLNALSYWLMWPAFIFLACAMVVEGDGPATGWTAYPPVSHASVGDGQTLWCMGVWFVGWSSICGAVNYITTIVKMRAPGMTLWRMPLTVWGIFITAILILCATPVLGSAMTMLILDRSLGSSFFLAGGRLLTDVPQFTGSGRTILWQHLFWFYSHPAVYIMVLPTMGIVSDMLACGVRKPIFGYRPMVYAMAAISGLGFIVWGHHMFQSGMNPHLGRTFMMATMMIALPSAIKTFNWLGTIYRGQIHFTVPTLCSLAFISMWIIGGLSGIFMAATPVDVQIHDTYAIVAHFHYVVFGATLFAAFGGVFYWFPKMFGRMMNVKVAKLHFWITFIAFNGTFFPMHIVGSRGMLRRTSDPYYYGDLQGMLPMNQFMTICAIILGLTQLLLIANFFGSMWFGKKITDRNPWNATTLEWSTPTPPVGHGNFDRVPRVYRGPYEYSPPNCDKDFLGQWEEPTDSKEGCDSSESDTPPAAS